jgi:hypothetical protein
VWFHESHLLFGCEVVWEPKQGDVCFHCWDDFVLGSCRVGGLLDGKEAQEEGAEGALLWDGP